MIDEQEKRKIASLYEKGASVTSICTKHKLSRSTVYDWIKKYAMIERPSGEVSDVKQIYLLEKRLKRLETELSIWQKSGCSIESPVSKKLEAILMLHEEYGVHPTCETLGVRRSTFYHYQRRRPIQTQVQKDDELLKPKIEKIFKDTRGRLGSKKIRIKLMELDFVVSVSRVSRLMKEMGLKCVSHGNVPKRLHNGSSKYYRNKLGQSFTQTDPNRVWVSDITHLYVDYCRYNLCVVIDLFSRKVIAYTLSDDESASLVINIFKKAYTKRQPTDLMFHSDQGVQYTAFDFKNLLRERQVTQSFSNAGYPYDNAVAESFFRALKSEEASQYYYKTFDELEKSISEYIYFYNTERPHQSLNYLTPDQVEKNYKG